MNATDANDAAPELLIARGHAAARDGDTIAARAAFRRATELAPAHAAAWHTLAGVTAVLRDRRAHLVRALALAPDDPAIAADLTQTDAWIAAGLALAPSQRRIDAAADQPVASAPDVMMESCYRHPERSTGLRCTQCDQPICGSCATLSPVGQLCPDCRTARRPPNYQVDTSHWLLGGLAAFGVAFGVHLGIGLIALFAGFLGLFIAAIAGSAAGELIGRVVDRVTRLKRGRTMQLAVGVAIGVSGLMLAPLLGVPVLLACVLAIIATVRYLR
jgi:hypothetical protein